MGQEIERKFLVRNADWRVQADEGMRFRQAYLHSDSHVAIRVRVVGDEAYLTIKGGGGIVRAEYEYAISAGDAQDMIDTLCGDGIVDKTRYLVRNGGHVWEVDVFAGDNEGLVVAEIELSSPDEPFARPSWLGREVSDDPRYLNANLVKRPYRLWRTQA